MPFLTLLEEQKLAYVETPKVASTTLLAALLFFAGLPLQGDNPRRMLRGAKQRARMADLGISRLTVTETQLRRLRAQNPDYFWFGASREPMARLISAYHNKLHRYARRYDRVSYLRAQIARLAAGSQALGDSRYTALLLGRHLSFADLVAGLECHGVGVDKHFDLQTRLLCFCSIRYHRLLRQEHLEADLRTLCAEISQPYPFPDGLPRLNASSLPGKADIRPSPELVTRIHDLYAEDFDKLGYR